ncbi:MAG: efflux RND transporter periplasmic adaptor subunit [Chloroherpetonaceae bacterium]
MNFLKPLLITLSALALLVFLLMFNKSKMDAQAESPASEKPILVATITAEKRLLAHSISGVGAIEAQNDVTIISETHGKVTKVFADVGAKLSVGDAVVQVDSELKYATFIAAEAQFEKAKKDFARYEVLHRESGIAEHDLEQVRLALKQAEANFIVAKRQLSDATIRTPISGVLTERKFNIGEMIQPDAPVATVVNTASLKVVVFISESDVMKLGVGDEVPIELDVYPTHRFIGKIKSISEKATDAGSYRVEVAFSNQKETPVKVGMTARLTFGASAKREAVVLPRLAVQGGGKSMFVYTVENGIAVQTPVKTGRSAGSDVEIVSGLNGGELVVTAGQTLLKPGAKVSINAPESR